MLYSLYSISFVHLEVVAGFVPEPSCKHHAVLPLLGHLPHLRTEVTATPWQSDTDLALSICVNLLDEPYHILAYPNIILYTCVCVGTYPHQQVTAFAELGQELWDSKTWHLRCAVAKF